MFKQSFAAAIKVGGRVLRELDGSVLLPFGSEYAIYLKNLNSRRAMVKISIDGVDVLNGSSLVIEGSQSLDLERFVRDHFKGNRFKFIERTSAVERHRGIGAEDGLVRIEFAFERSVPLLSFNDKFNDNWLKRYNNPMIADPYYIADLYYNRCAVVYNSMNVSGSVSSSSGAHPGTATLTSASASAASRNDAGITVAGSISDQNFSTVSSFVTNAPEVMVLKLVGDVGRVPVAKAVTVKRNVRCKTCSRNNKTTAKFCSECGTALDIIFA